MSNQETRDSLKKFIGSINANRIKLINISSKSNENLSGTLQGGSLERNVEINLESVGTGQQNDSDLVIFGSYLVKINDAIDEKSLVSFEAEYKVILTMKDGVDFTDKLTEDQQKIVGIYFNQSGRIILFPYVRHLYDMIVRESDLFLPPLPPILFKS